MNDPRIDKDGNIDYRDWETYKENSYVVENANGTYTDRSTGKIYWADGTLKEG